MKMQSDGKPRWRRAFAAAALATVVAAGGYGLQAGVSTAEQSPTDTARSRAVQQLQQDVSAAQSDTLQERTESVLDAEQMAAIGESRVAELGGLPPGHELSVNWAAGAESGGDNVFGIRQVAELNAACHWLGYLVAHGAATDGARIVESLANWPSIRGSESMAKRFDQLAAQMRAGDLSGAKIDVDANCPGAIR